MELSDKILETLLFPVPQAPDIITILAGMSVPFPRRFLLRSFALYRKSKERSNIFWTDNRKNRIDKTGLMR